jgi:hypothetical protein
LGAEHNFRWDKALASAEAMEDEELGSQAVAAQMKLLDVIPVPGTCGPSDADFARFPRLKWRNPLA